MTVLFVTVAVFKLYVSKLAASLSLQAEAIHKKCSDCTGYNDICSRKKVGFFLKLVGNIFFFR